MKKEICQVYALQGKFDSSVLILAVAVHYWMTHLIDAGC